jgi:hypothetical protein
MLIRLALILPLALAAALVTNLLVPMTAPPVYNPLSESERTPLMLILPPLYLVGTIWASTLYASWFAGRAPLPGWVQRGLQLVDGFLGRSPLDRVQAHQRPPTAMGLWARAVVAVSTFLYAAMLLAVFVPVYAIFLLWLRSDVYRPWEAAVWIAAGVGTLAWIGYLAYRYLTFRAAVSNG